MANRWAGMIPMQAQSEIINEMARNMVASIAGDWAYATYTVSRFGGQGQGPLFVFDRDGNSRLGDDMASFRLSTELKRVMFVEGRGSWFTMTLTVRNGGSVEAKFDYETKPVFGQSLPGVTPYYTSREQLEFHRDLDHQPDWYRESLKEFMDAEQARLDLWVARDKLWSTVGVSSDVSNSVRLVVQPTGVGLLATDGYSNPSPNHPGDPGFELYLPSALFVGDVATARETWPGRHLVYLMRTTTEEDIDWPSRAEVGPQVVSYYPNIANNTPESWRGRDEAAGEDVCGMLVGVPFPGVPDHLDGPDGPFRLIGVLPARPAEWAYLKNGEPTAGPRLLGLLAGLSPGDLASPDRPSVV